MNKRPTIEQRQESFIKESQDINGYEKYGYSFVFYINNDTKVKIECFKPDHGIFYQTPHAHKRGEGCPKCRDERRSEVQCSNTEEFIKKAIKVHGLGTYGYSMVEYINNHTKVKIICFIHGVFEQTPNNHLFFGCKKCADEKNGINHRMDTETFIKKAQEEHGLNTYDYSKSIYTKANELIIIKCHLHGFFKQMAYKHLDGRGCPHCKSSRGEKYIYKFLSEHLNLKFEKEKRFKECKFKRELPFDFYLPDYNTCIEFDGPQHFKPTYFWRGKELSENEAKSNYEKIKLSDSIKTNFCKNNNINLIRISYKDINNIPNILDSKIKELCVQ